MVFSTLTFLFIFFPIVLAVYYMLKPLPIMVRNVWLFAASIFFYAWGEPKYVLVMVLAIASNYVFGLLIEKHETRTRKVFLALGICLDLSVLFIYKYTNFFVETVHRLLPNFLPDTNILLPIGISFYTFQAISYLVDVYRKKSFAQRNPINVGLYIAFFPQLIAGPIVRYDSIAEQILNRRENINDFTEGIKRFCQGFLKKILLANTCGMIADSIYDEVALENPVAVTLAWLGMITYTLQIFFDFSGYSDMAIGLGKMFGFTFCENFNYPYISGSVSEFWRRWHMSLGGWFRDYVYIPLGGSRVGRVRLVINTFVVWFLTGLWHGANWTFIGWGMFYFILISLEKIVNMPKYLEKSRLVTHLYRTFTIFAVGMGFVLFRSPSISRALLFYKCMFGLAGNELTSPVAVRLVSDNIVVLIAAIALSTPVIKNVSDRFNQRFTRIDNILTPIVYMLLMLYGISFLIMDFYNPFIYFNF